MDLIPVETGTKQGYEDYHGEVYADSHKLIGGWNYDKKQSLYVATFSREYEIRKRFYAPSVSQLVQKMSNWIKQNPLPCSH